MGMDGVSEKGGVHVLTIRDGRRGGFCQMAGEGRQLEVRVKRRDLDWIRKVDRRREGTKTRRSSETRRNGGILLMPFLRGGKLTVKSKKLRLDTILTTLFKSPRITSKLGYGKKKTQKGTSTRW